MSKKIDVVSGALAASICPGCHYYDKAHTEHNRQGAVTNEPCPYYEPGNFYYDNSLHRFWCHSWEGNQCPSTAAKRTEKETG